MVQMLHSVAQAADWLAARVRPQGAPLLRTDSRSVRAGDAFIAWPGAATDGRQYVAGALAAGAAACLVEADGVDGFGFADERIATLPGLKAATGPLAAAWFGQPAQALQRRRIRAGFHRTQAAAGGASKVAPAPSANPRRKSAAPRRLPPARCNWVTHSTPSPQAIRTPSSLADNICPFPASDGRSMLSI